MRLKVRSNDHLFPTFLALLFSGIGLGLISLYFSTGQYGGPLFIFYLSQPLTLVLNLLPFVLFGFLCFFLTNRLWSAFALNSILCFAFSWPNYWKLLARDAPLIASDLLIVSEAMDMSSRYIEFTPFMFLSFLAVLGVTILFATALHGQIKRKVIRLLCFVLVILVCLFLFYAVYDSTDIYDAQSNWSELTEWFTTTGKISRGGIYPFIYSIPEAFHTAPSGYDEESAIAMIKAYESDPIAQDQQASVIIVMLEAFADLSDLTDAITAADPYELYHQLQEESYCGKLVTNVFAGGTNNTEQCVVTGYPYLSSFNIPSWSYARYFSAQGYAINGAHAGFQGFYNRNIVNYNLGFPDYRFIDNYYNHLPKGTLASRNQLEPSMAHYLKSLYAKEIPMDFQFFPEITDYCKDQIEAGQPVYSFNVTYQNHGPYPTDVSLFTKEYIPSGLINEADYNIANNYLAGIEETAKRMNEMVDAFRDYEEPVVLVFFGDHNPWLGDQNSTYHALGIDISSDTDASFLNYYSTDYLIWANDAAKAKLDKSFVGTGPTISPAFLMNVLFEQCGWAGPDYKKLADDVMNTVPVIHQTGIYASNGALVSGSELSAEQASLLHRLNCVRYYFTNKYMLAD